MRTTRLSSNFDRKATRSGILVHSSSTELRNGHLNAGKRATLTIRWSLTYPLTLLQVIFLYVTMPLYMLVVTCWRPYSRLCSGMVRRSVIDLILFSYRYAQALKWKLFPHTRLSWIHVSCFLRGRRTIWSTIVVHRRTWGELAMGLRNNLFTRNNFLFTF